MSKTTKTADTSAAVITLAGMAVGALALCGAGLCMIAYGVIISQGTSAAE